MPRSLSGGSAIPTVESSCCALLGRNENWPPRVRAGEGLKGSEAIMILYSASSGPRLRKGLFCRVIAHIFGDLHRARVRLRRRAEVRRFCALLGKRFVMEFPAVTGSRLRLSWSSHRNSNRAFERALSGYCAPDGSWRGRRRAGDLVGDNAPGLEVIWIPHAGKPDPEAVQG